MSRPKGASYAPALFAALRAAHNMLLVIIISIILKLRIMVDKIKINLETTII